VTSVAGRRIVARACERAERAGVRAGMSVSHALALLPGGASGAAVRVEPFTPERDVASLEALAVWAIRFAPFAAPDEPDGLLLDVTGCEPLYGGPRGLVDRMAEAVARLGFSCRVALAPTFGCAWAAARYGARSRLVIEPGEMRAALAPLPVRSLRLEGATVEALAEVGIDRVGDLLRLRRRDLATRFGDELLLRLDQSLGQAMETITPVRPQELLRLERMFAGPTPRLDAIELAVRDLLEALPPRLEEREAGARRVDLVLVRSDLPKARLVFRLGRPSRDPKHLWALVRPRLETVHLGFGVEGVAVEVPWLGRLAARQRVHPATGLRDEPLERREAVGNLVDALAARIGWDRVGRVEAVESHLPERAFRMRSLLDGADAMCDVRILPGRRPTVLFDPPEPVAAVTGGDGARARVGVPRKLRRGGVAIEIVAFVGPERIASEWWREEATAARLATAGDDTREYYAVQDSAGRWLWIFRERASGAWFVQGEWR